MHDLETKMLLKHPYPCLACAALTCFAPGTDTESSTFLAGP